VKPLVTAAAALLSVVLAVVSVVLATTVGAFGVARTGLAPGAPVPSELAPVIEAAGTTCPLVTPALLAAQLDQESGFRADAESPAGAEGIAQFLPGTWASWGVDADGDGVADPFDPVDAIWSDARLLCSLVARAVRSGLRWPAVSLALAGYNAGWGAVLRFGAVPPYPQTQRYVRAILSAVPVYSALSTAPSAG
jgi:peptidoglycan DL-endopeptidase RipA